MIERLELLESKYNDINTKLMDPSILCDIKKSSELSKELSDMKDTIDAYHRYKNILKGINDTKEMLKDPEMFEIANEELTMLEQDKEKILKEIDLLLIPKDKNDGKNVIIEIRGAAGGDEGNIFAGDLFRMYTRYAEKCGYNVEILNAMDGEAGGYTLIEFMIKGKNVYSKFKYESGAHRVQRIPVTEANGRIQTSTATVLVMPEATEVEIDVKESDIKVDVYRSSGAGGQHVNTTDSAVRMTHIPTGIVVTCQNERSQIKNREKAFQILKARIYEEMQKQALDKDEIVRKSKIGTGDRSEKIRTYNYPQNRVTDHRIGYSTMHLDRIMEGDLDEVIEALTAEEQKRQLEAI